MASVTNNTRAPDCARPSAAARTQYTIIAELANGSIGYIPTARAYDEGNYEPISARCAKGSGEALVAVATRLLAELHAQRN